TLALDDRHWAVRQVLESAPAATTVVALPSDTPWPRGPCPIPPSHAVLLPIRRPADARPAGLLIAALNPCRPFDREYESFVRLYAGEIAAGLARAEACAAARTRVEAHAQTERTRTAFFANESHERRTERLAAVFTHAPVAIAILRG